MHGMSARSLTFRCAAHQETCGAMRCGACVLGLAAFVRPNAALRKRKVILEQSLFVLGFKNRASPLREGATLVTHLSEKAKQIVKTKCPASEFSVN